MAASNDVSDYDDFSGPRVSDDENEKTLELPPELLRVRLQIAAQQSRLGPARIPFLVKPGSARKQPATRLRICDDFASRSILAWKRSGKRPIAFERIARNLRPDFASGIQTAAKLPLRFGCRTFRRNNYEEGSHAASLVL
jgi:hypothetical protein